MHTLGKVFLWINFCLLIGAVLLSAKLINARNYWMDRVEKKEQQIATNDQQLADKEKQVKELRASLVQQRLAWDTMFVAPNSRADAQGNVTVGVGPDQGFGNIQEGDPAPVIHVFVPRQEGSFYLGPFQLTAARGSQSQLQPMFRPVTANPAQDWQPGNWRLWQMIPSQAPSQVVQLTSDIVRKLEAVKSRQATLALQQKAVEQAQQHLEGRQMELFGNPQAPQIEGAPEVSLGLVAALRDAEAARNVELARLVALRREVDHAYERLTQLVGQNEQLVQQLPGGGPALGLSSAQ